MTTPFFSIIIPVYNGLSNGLPECLDSIWSQPLSSDLYEVITVDDCSTDDTRQWLYEQAQLHTNMQVVENEVNIRQGGGRNRGVKVARGKYILFIDQDDYYHKDSLLKVYELLQEYPELDVLMCDNAIQYVGHESNKLQLNLHSEEVYATGLEFLEKNGWAIAPWRYCIKRDFYLSKDLWFAEGCRIEDVDWVFKLFRYAGKMKYFRLLLIHYNKGTGSTTDNTYKNFEILSGGNKAACRLYEVAQTLYVGTDAYHIVADIAEFYFNCTCKSLFGSYWPIKVQKELLQTIPLKHSKHKLLNFALRHSTLFCIMTNIGVIPFRIARYFRRKMKARKYEG